MFIARESGPPRPPEEGHVHKELNPSIERHHDMYEHGPPDGGRALLMEAGSPPILAINMALLTESEKPRQLLKAHKPSVRLNSVVDVHRQRFRINPLLFALLFEELRQQVSHLLVRARAV